MEFPHNQHDHHARHHRHHSKPEEDQSPGQHFPYPRPSSTPFYLPPPDQSFSHHESSYPSSYVAPHHGHDRGHGHPHGTAIFPSVQPSFFLPQGREVRVFCKAGNGFSLTIRDGSVVLAPYDPSDKFQHWIKDEKYCTRVKDEESFPSFALVNMATGLALQHSIGGTQPVRLIPYPTDKLDMSILWTLSKDLGDGFRTIRMVDNICLNLDAFHGDKNHGGVHDGTVAVLWEWTKGDNQRWKLYPY
ncbi:ricin B-like lectin R40G3 [Amborella trichopoda]|nr:ricin B-like lectin R40G3 [Amborella trichopoda]|eukprot:XP_011622435.1 ricin B-like lectin R40G3 [Amborella trichopoda]